MISKLAPPLPISHGRPELDRVRALPEDAADLVARAQVRRRVVLGAQPAQVDDPQSGGAGRRREGHRRRPVALLELGPLHGVDEVVSGVAPVKGGVDAGPVADVDGDGLTGALVARRLSCPGHHLVAALVQRRRQRPPHETGGTRHQDPHGGRPTTSRPPAGR